MIAVSRVIEGPGFVDNPLAAFLRFNYHTLDLIQPICDLRVQRNRRLDGCLCVEFGWKGDLKQNVLHDVGTKALRRDPDRITSEEHMLESPDFCAQGARVTHFAAERMQSEPDGTAGRVAGCPRFARSGVRCVSVGAQRPAVDKGVRQGIYYILARSAE